MATGDRPRPRSAKGQGKGTFWHDCIGIKRRGWRELVWGRLGTTLTQTLVVQSVFHTLLSSFTTSS